MVATNYPGLKLAAQIENADFYQSCLWRSQTSSTTIFSRGSNPCNTNRTEPNFELSCVETDNVVTTTATFRSPMKKENEGLYELRCRVYPDLSESAVAQINIKVSGIIP